MKEYYKQYRANSGPWEGMEVVTVCTIQEGNSFGRGVAVCSFDDSPDTEKGKFYARNYALRAVKGRKDIPITDRRAAASLLRTDCPFIHHSQSNPILTFQERKFFFGKRYLEETGQRVWNENWTVKTTCPEYSPKFIE
jgi:hypothetical protein